MSLARASPTSRSKEIASATTTSRRGYQRWFTQLYGEPHRHSQYSLLRPGKLYQNRLAPYNSQLISEDTCLLGSSLSPPTALQGSLLGKETRGLYIHEAVSTRPTMSGRKEATQAFFPRIRGIIIAVILGEKDKASPT